MSRASIRPERAFEVIRYMSLNGLMETADAVVFARDWTHARMVACELRVGGYASETDDWDTREVIPAVRRAVHGRRYLRHG